VHNDPHPLLISEIFHSLQGEGELAGVPSVFVRTAGCNLRCTWCDTPYASSSPEGKLMSVEEIVAEVSSHTSRHVVLTGGEPMLAPELPELAASLRAVGKHITIETAATITPSGIACDLASLSPKLRNSTPPPAQFGAAWSERHEALRWQPAAIAAWLAAYEFQLKFVVATEADVAEVESLLAQLPMPPPRHKVLLMPEGTTRETLAARTPWLTALCRDRGYRFAPRLHIDWFGNKRGV
jgi:7-carboxy-7-deazaguanine synthase